MSTTTPAPIATVRNPDAGALIAARAPFANHGGTFTGTPRDGAWPTVGTLGELPAGPADELRAVADRVDYVVRSYATPIAWHTRDGWTVPEVKYSSTTSRHQGIVRGAIHATTPAPCVDPECNRGDCTSVPVTITELRRLKNTHVGGPRWAIVTEGNGTYRTKANSSGVLAITPYDTGRRRLHVGPRGTVTGISHA